MPLGFSEKWQRRDWLLWIGDNPFQQRLKVSDHPLDCRRLEQVGVVLEKPDKLPVSFPKVQ